MTSLTHKAQDVFQHDRFATEATGIRVDEVREDYARCLLTLEAKHRNAMGAIMGGVMFTLADLAFAIAANNHCLANNQPLQWVSLNSSIHYLGQTQGNTLVAETICVKQGSSTCVYTISIHDENDKPIAIVTTTGIHLN
jgi:acyl-CoA thioesterase